jgi:hypothetical protein
LTGAPWRTYVPVREQPDRFMDVIAEMRLLRARNDERIAELVCDQPGMFSVDQASLRLQLPPNTVRTAVRRGVVDLRDQKLEQSWNTGAGRPAASKAKVLVGRVGAEGIEPPTSCASCMRSNRLSYAPWVRPGTLPRRPQPLRPNGDTRPLLATEGLPVATGAALPPRTGGWSDRGCAESTRSRPCVTDGIPRPCRRADRGGCHARAIYAELPACLPRFSHTCRARRPTD